MKFLCLCAFLGVTLATDEPGGYHPEWDVCPQIDCPTWWDPAIAIPFDCQKYTFMIGSDGATRCTLCGASFCGSQQEVCPQIQCPGDADIPDGCRKPEFTIGRDGITKCRMCDSNFCGDPMLVCPAIQCPNMPKQGCSKPQFVIGLDDVTMCPVCPKDICQNA
ncbi:uncharacterized protein LOC127853460 [Dreissena polymorpha]|uniref:uncharacterized protein LOC127853460 n=1 Tax=Dreissena polymorpha TaxID=45954 RepID=UPI002263BBBA|nr:uncharacterized protein LOC127853460 [Dreissena polymorpha]